MNAKERRKERREDLRRKVGEIILQIREHHDEQKNKHPDQRAIYIETAKVQNNPFQNLRWLETV